MLTEIILELIEENRKAHHALRAKVEKRAQELNAGWAKTRYSRDGFDLCVEPTWGKDDRPHAPFDGYLWENEAGEVEAYHAGSYLPYVTELESLDKPDYTGDHGWWKIRLTTEMFVELSLCEYVENQAPYKSWELPDNTTVVMAKVRAHKKVLEAIQEYSRSWFDDYYTKAKADKGDAPEGKLAVKGRVVSTKVIEDYFGVISKMTVLMENGSTVYGTLPKAVPIDYRGNIEFTAMFTQALNDRTHSFYKNPCRITLC